MNLGSDVIEELKNKKLTLEVYLDDVRNKRKIDDNANFTGSWFGIKKPVLIEGGIDGVVELLQKTIETLSKNGLIVDNVTDFVNDFKNICQSNSTIIIPNGIYEIKSYCLIENLENLTIEFRDNAILKDMCKDILLTDGTLGKVPYGIEFKNCNNLKIKGLRHTNILTPSSKKVSDGSISERTPNISFTNCNNLDVSLSFEGLTGLSNDSIFSDSYAVGKNYNDVLFARLSLMYCRFFNCSNVKIHDVKIGMIAGENIGIGNCNFVDFYQNSHFGNDLTNDVYGIWSFAKIINSNNVISIILNHIHCLMFHLLIFVVKILRLKT
jgi:hypothetical protein